MTKDLHSIIKKCIYILSGMCQFPTPLPFLLPSLVLSLLFVFSLPLLLLLLLLFSWVRTGWEKTQLTLLLYSCSVRPSRQDRQLNVKNLVAGMSFFTFIFRLFLLPGK